MKSSGDERLLTNIKGREGECRSTQPGQTGSGKLGAHRLADAVRNLLGQGDLDLFLLAAAVADNTQSEGISHCAV